MNVINSYRELVEALDLMHRLSQNTLNCVANPIEHANAMLKQQEFFTSVLAPSISRAKYNSLSNVQQLSKVA